MWVFADLADDELAYYAQLPCLCHTAANGGTRYTCAAHRAQAELDRRTVSAVTDVALRASQKARL